MSKDEVWVFSEYCKEHRVDNIFSSDLYSLGKKSVLYRQINDKQFSTNQQNSM